MSQRNSLLEIDTRPKPHEIASRTFRFEHFWVTGRNLGPSDLFSNTLRGFRACAVVGQMPRRASLEGRLGQKSARNCSVINISYDGNTDGLALPIRTGHPPNCQNLMQCQLVMATAQVARIGTTHSYHAWRRVPNRPTAQERLVKTARGAF